MNVIQVALVDLTLAISPARYPSGTAVTEVVGPVISTRLPPYVVKVIFKSKREPLWNWINDI